MAVEEDVSLQVCLEVEQVVLVGNVACEVIVEDVEDAAHPEGVAGVDQLVGPPVVPSEFGLPLREPLDQPGYVQLLQSAQKGQRCHSAESEAAVGLSSDHIRNASLVALRKEHGFSDSFEYVGGKVECFGDERDDEDGP